jgi:Domain of unknown function (DUF5667)
VSVRSRSGHARDDLVVAALQELAPHLDGEPDPAFRAATRARLVAMAAVRTPAPAPVSGLRRLLAARAPDAPPTRRRARLTAGLAGAALTVTALAALVAVADGARPGDVLYDLKRGTEETQLALAGDSRGRTLLDFAGTRLDELEVLVGDGGTALPAAASLSAAGGDPALVLETLRTMDEQTAEGTAWLTHRAVETSDSGQLEYLAGWATGQADGLAALQDEIPAPAADAAERSLGLLTEIGARTDVLQAVLDCPAGPAVGGTDDLGPVPAGCATPDPAAPATGGGSPGSGPSTPGGSGTAATTTPALPADPSPTGAAPGGSGPRLPTPGLPSPSPGGLLPSLPSGPSLPGSGKGPGTAGSTGSGATSTSPALPSLTVCLPPLATVGNC